jgi:predicted protein tyrosine phosphatase
LVIGTSQRLTTLDLAWGDAVAVMELQDMALIRRRWPHHAAKVLVLDVPDDYDPGEPEVQASLTPNRSCAWATSC